MILSKTIRSALVILLLWSSASFAFDTLKIDVTLDTAKKVIGGYVKYTLPAIPMVSSYEFQLFPNVYSNADSPYLKNFPHLLEFFRKNNGWGSMVIDSVLIDNKNASDSLKIDYTKGVIRSSDYTALNNKTVVIFFKTRIPQMGDRLSYSGSNYLLDGWFPAPAILQDNGNWYNPKYGPFTELVGDYFQFEIDIRTPQNFKVAAAVPSVATPLGDASTNHRFTFGPAHDFALALSPDYFIDSSLMAGKSVRILYRDFEWPALDRLKTTVSNALEFMQKEIGPYHYDNLTIATANIADAGGVEFPGMIALSLPYGGMAVGRIYEMLVVHETIHQWFYGMIGSDQIETPWMDESVSSYFSMRVLERYWGSDANLLDFGGFRFSERDLLRSMSETPLGGSSINRPAYSFPGEADYFGTIYGRGALAIETIDRLMGDSLSSVFWPRYFKTYLFKHPASDDFLNLIGETAGRTVRLAAEELLNNSDDIDYAIYDLSNRKVDSMNYEAHLTLKRRGMLESPVDYRLILLNGDTLDYMWAPQYDSETKVHRLPSPAISAIVDPDNIYAIDKNLFNNSIMINGDGKPGFRLSSGITFMIESLLSFIGGM